MDTIFAIMSLLSLLILLCMLVAIIADEDSELRCISFSFSWLLTIGFILITFVCITKLENNPDQHIKDYLNGKIVPQTTIIDQDTTVIYIYKK